MASKDSPQGDGRPDVVVREAMEPELPIVESLLLEVFAATAARMPGQIGANYLAEVADVGGRRASSVVFVAMSDTDIVGTVTFLPRAADDRHPWPSGGCVLRLLAVTPRARGQGAGRALVQACIDRARSLGRSFVGLHTASIMEGGRRLYDSMGFVPAPAWDFDAGDHYAGGPAGDELRGLAFVYPLD